jgi:glycoprotein-N-acetylgalactosamine 3-beta-galactosyltransferase
VFTHAKVHSKVHYVHNTWGNRCDKVIYMTGPKQPEQKDDPNFKFVYLNMTDEYNRITEKALLTFEYIYDNLMEEFDWFVRANDDTYIIMENLKLFLANRCSDDMSIYGKVLKHTHMSKHYNAGDNSKGFLQGGTGVIISREALRLFVQALRNDSQFCVMFHGGFEDQEIANCFRKINIYPGDTRDGVYRERFFMEMFHQIWEQPSDVYSSHSINKVQLVIKLFLEKFLNDC